MSRNIVIVGSGLGVVFLLIAPQILGTYYLGLLTLMLIWAIAAMSLDIVLGYTGLPSLAHAAFFGGAAYTVGLLAVKANIGTFWLPLIAGLATAAILGLVYGFLVLRTRGAYFMLLTLALAQVLWAIALKWRSLTGGNNGLPGVGRPGFGVVTWSLWPIDNFYYFSLAFFLLATGIMYLIVHSPFGRTLTGIRENEARMEVLGYNVWLHKYIAFILGAIFAGLAGVLFVYYNGIASPPALSALTSAKILIMVLLGGRGTLFGPILGVAAITMLENYLGAYTERWTLVLGLIYVMVTMFAPNGLAGLATNKLWRLWRWKRALGYR